LQFRKQEQVLREESLTKYCTVSKFILKIMKLTQPQSGVTLIVPLAFAFATVLPQQSALGGIVRLPPE
jgi:hypothetical protein